MPLLTKQVLKGYAKIALLIFIFAVIYAIDLLVLTIATNGLFWKQFTSSSKTESMTLLYIAVLYFSILSAAIVFWKKNTDINVIKAFFQKDKNNSALKGVVCGAAIFALFFGLAVLPGFFYSKIEIHGGINHALIFLMLNALSCFALAFAEELIFRGIIFNLLKKDSGLIQALIVTSAIFAGAHMFSPGTALYKTIYFTNLFLMSLCLCYGNLIFKNIWFSIGAHWVLIYLFLIRNYFGFLKISPSHSNIFLGFSDSPMSGIYATLIFSCSAYFLLKAVKKSNAGGDFIEKEK